MSEEDLRKLASGDLSEEEVARALLQMTLDVAPPEVADAVRACALPSWFDAELLGLLCEVDEARAAELLEKVAAFSFVTPRPDGRSYVYHEATRARLLDEWRAPEEDAPERRARYVALVDRLAEHVLAAAQTQDRRLRGPEFVEALVVWDALYPNFRAAWEESVATENWARVRSFGYRGGGYLSLRGLGQEDIVFREQAIVACEQLDDWRGWAAIQNSLGEAYRELLNGDRGENLARAIECYQEALTVYTPETTPLDYAMAQNNLGLAYWALPTGDRGENLARAIKCYQEALHFYTPEAAPREYARTQNNLGLVHWNLPTGDRGKNLARAIECYREALRFYTLEAAPLDYAMTQNNLGNAYAALPPGAPPGGDRAQNLARAIECFQEALRFYTPETAPFEYARTQNNLALVYFDLEDYAQAIDVCKQVIAVDVENHAAHYNASCAYSLLGNAKEAVAWLEKAIALNEDYRQQARDDPDFNGIRTDPAFRALIDQPK